MSAASRARVCSPARGTHSLSFSERKWEEAKAKAKATGMKIYVTGSVYLAVALMCGYLSKFYIDGTINAKNKYIQNDGALAKDCETVYNNKSANESRNNFVVHSKGCSVEIKTEDIRGNIIDMSFEDFKCIFEFLSSLNKVDESFEKLHAGIKNKNLEPAEKRKFVLHWYGQVLNELNTGVAFLMMSSTRKYKFNRAGVIEKKLIAAHANLKEHGVVVSGEQVVGEVEKIIFFLKELGVGEKEGKKKKENKKQKDYWSGIVSVGSSAAVSALVAAAVAATVSGKNN